MAQKPPTSPEDDPIQQRYDQASVEDAIKKIERAHSLGLSSNAKHGERLYEKRDVMVKFAAKLGLRRDAVERARQFAREFSKKEVYEICKLCRKHNFPLGVTLILRTFAVKNRKKRMALIGRVIREGWTQARLSAEIRDIPGALHHKGRGRSLPDSREEARQQIVTRLGPNLRWLNDLISKREEHVGGLKKQINATIASLEALVKAAKGDSQKKP
jgi:hypothetical protein